MKSENDLDISPRGVAKPEPDPQALIAQWTWKSDAMKAMMRMVCEVALERGCRRPFSALDLAVDRLEEQLRRMHERSKSITHRRPNPIMREFLTNESTIEAVEPDSDLLIDNGPLHVQLMHLEFETMSIEKAIDQMELLGHYFFVFRNQDTDKPCVLYRKHGYDYGLVQLDQAS